MAYKIERKYVILERTEDGLLKTPKQGSGWYPDESLFNSYGYDSLEEAEEALSEHTKRKHKDSKIKWHSNSYLIVPEVQAVHNE